MKTISLTALSALLAASPICVMAESWDQDSVATTPIFDDRWYITPFATYTWADEDRNTDDAAGFGLNVGKPINKWLNLELRATYTNLVSESHDNFTPGTGDYEVGDVGIDGLLFFSRDKVQPFLLGGIGAVNDDFDCDRTYANLNGGCTNSGSKWSFMAEAGAGILVPINDYASFRVDARYRYDDNSGDLGGNSNFGDWMVTAGISIPIGRRAKPVTSKTFELSADALFGFNKDTLSPTGVSTINNFSRDLNKVSYTDVQVDGHTDPIGSVAYNQDLSERRANTVRGRMVSQGVPGDRITARGYGKSRLKVTEADCAHAKSRQALIECYQPDRRVEVTVEGMSEK